MTMTTVRARAARRWAAASRSRDWWAMSWRWAAVLFCVDFWLGLLKVVGVL